MIASLPSPGRPVLLGRQEKKARNSNQVHREIVKHARGRLVEANRPQPLPHRLATKAHRRHGGGFAEPLHAVRIFYPHTYRLNARATGKEVKSVSRVRGQE